MKISQKLVLAIIVISTGLFFLSREVEPKTDVLWYHFIGYRLFEPDRTLAAVQTIPLTGDYENLEISRREIARLNYPIFEISAYASHLFLHKNLPFEIYLGIGLPYIIGAIIFLYSALKSRCVEGLILVVSYFSITALLPGPGYSDHLFYYGDLRDLFNLAVLLTNPGGGLSPLSVQPKSTVFLIFVGCLALRWSGRRRLAYGLMALPVLWHVTLAIGVLGLFVVVDVIAAWLKRHDLKTETLLFSGLSLLGAFILTIYYLMVRGNMLWGVESAAIQLAARLLILTEITLVTYAGCWSWNWLKRHANGCDEKILMVASVFVAFVSFYSSLGMTWEKGRAYSHNFSDDHYISQYGPLAIYYNEAIKKLE